MIFRLFSGMQWWQLTTGLISLLGFSSAAFSASGAPNPKNLIVTGTTGSSIAISWQSGGGATAGYTLAYLAGSVAPASKCTNGTHIQLGLVSSYIIQGLASSSQYSIRLCAKDSRGRIANSGVTVSAVTAEPAPPPPPAPNLVWQKAAADPTANILLMSTTHDNVSKKVYSVGTHEAGEPRWYIEARSGVDGTLISSFGNGGSLSIDSDGGAMVTPAGRADLNYVAASIDGGIYVCGVGCASSTCSTSSQLGMVIAKFDAQGSLLWKRAPVAGGTCSVIRTNVEDGVEYIYGYGKYIPSGETLGDVVLAKYDASGNQPAAPVWSGDISIASPENEAMNENYYNMTKGSDGIYLYYFSAPRNSGIVEKYSFAGVKQAEAVLGSGVAQAAIRTGTVQGVEYLWVAKMPGRKIDLYHTDLTSVNSSEFGCNNLDLAPFGVEYAVYDLWVKNNGAESYLYLSGRHSLDPALNPNSMNAIVSRFRMTSTECISENEAGEAYDMANHSFNFLAPNTRDGFVKMHWDNLGDIFLTGYGSGADGNYRGHTLKISGQ